MVEEVKKEGGGRESREGGKGKSTQDPPTKQDKNSNSSPDYRGRGL